MVQSTRAITRFDLCTEILSWRRSKIEKESHKRAYVAWLRTYLLSGTSNSRTSAAEKLSSSTKCPGYHPAINFSSEVHKFIKSVQWRDSVRYFAAGIFHRFILLSLFKAILRLRWSELLFTRTRSCAVSRINCTHTPWLHVFFLTAVRGLESKPSFLSWFIPVSNVLFFCSCHFVKSHDCTNQFENRYSINWQGTIHTQRILYK